MSNVIDLGYRARTQFVPYHQRTKRWAVLVCHRRAGKTVATIVDLVDAAIRCPLPNPRFAYIAPLLKQAKTVAWDYLKQYATRIPGAQVNETELRVDIPIRPGETARIRLFGADNPDALRGIYLDGCVLDEAADMAARLFTQIIRPALSDRGGWCTWIGTPKGHNDFKDKFDEARANPDEWFTAFMPASETKIVSDEELASARRQMSEDEYAQEYECSFAAAVQGSYYGNQIEALEEGGHVVPDLYDPNLVVNTAWDLGASDDTVIWFFQQMGMQIRIIDFYTSNGFGLDHYAKVLDDRKYRYGLHYFPFDVEQKILGGGEIARTRKQTLEGLGIPVFVAPKWPVEDGINAVRRILPRCWFDVDKTAWGLKCLRQYRRDYDEVRKVFMERPLHDWTSHAADGFRTLAVCVGEAASPKTKASVTPKSRKWIV